MQNQPSDSPLTAAPTAGTSSLRRIAVLPVRDTVLFPHAVLPLTVGRESSIQLIEALGDERAIIVATQLDARQDTPQPTDLHLIGTLATVHKVVRMPNQSRFVFTEGTERVRLVRFIQTEPFMIAEVETLEDVDPAASSGFEALERNVVAQFQQIVSESQTLSDELRTIAANIEEPSRLVDFVASSLPFLTTDEKQQLLEAPAVYDRLEQLNKLLAKEIEVQQLRAKIQNEVQDQVQQSQRDYYLREQLKAIQKELGEQDEGQRETEELRLKIEAAGMPDDVKKEALKELGRLSRMSPMAADYSLTRNYIEWLAVLPWAKSSGSTIDIAKAKETLDEDHYELTKVKERILDYLSVLELKPDMKGPILCFVGPPGVGKTSLGRSIARALGRKFQRISLGGMHDEAEIRGHRRTYIGAMPGQIIQSIRRAETNDPVIMLDEIDKLGRDFRGDPASALLETLDPEQNNTFRDNYLDVPFDLSKVLFICTANQLDPVPPPLLDRMELIFLEGYSEEEKLHIAERYLIPRQIKENGITPEQIEFPANSVLHLIRHYTREAGVRKIEQVIGTVCRKQARNVVEGKKEKLVVSLDTIKEFLGGIQVRVDTEVAERVKRPGVVHRGQQDDRQGWLHHDRPDRRSDAGVDAGGADLGPLECRKNRAGERLQQGPRPAHSRTGRRHSEGRSFGWRYHGHRARFSADRYTGPPTDGDDRGDYAERQRAAGRRHQGEVPGRAPRRHPDHYSARGKPAECRGRSHAGDDRRRPDPLCQTHRGCSGNCASASEGAPRFTSRSGGFRNGQHLLKHCPATTVKSKAGEPAGLFLVRNGRRKLDNSPRIADKKDRPCRREAQQVWRI
jgi:ATP-dependent Lon protease